MHPDKPTRVTCTIGNTIFGAISGERPVDWAIIFMELVNRLVGGAGKTKATPIFPFLYHLYESKGLLTKDEERGIHLCECRVESGQRRAMVGERKIDYSVVIFLEKEPLQPWKSGRLGSKFSLKLTKKTPKPWNMPSKIVR